MIHLEHINLVVTGIDCTLNFYRATFPHWIVRGGDQSTWYGKPRNWIHFGDDYQYIAFNDDGEGENRDLKGHQVGLAHFAFVTQKAMRWSLCSTSAICRRSVAVTISPANAR